MIFGSAVILNLIFLNVVKHISLALIKDEKRLTKLFPSNRSRSQVLICLKYSKNLIVFCCKKRQAFVKMQIYDHLSDYLDPNIWL